MPVRNGRKRLALVVTRGRSLAPLLHPASIQGRDRFISLFCASRTFYPFMAYVFTDSGHEHERVANAKSIVAAVRFSHAPRSPHNPAGMNFESDWKTNSQLRCRLSRSPVKSH
jgi:hypothetical protein